MEASIQKHEPTLERHVTYIQFFLLHSSLESGLIKGGLIILGFFFDQV